MRAFSRRDLVWDDKQLRLHSIGGRVLAAIEPDQTWPSMWRVRLPEGFLTDMVNLSRAKDAAVAHALATLNRRQEAAWAARRRKLPSGSVNMPRRPAQITQADVARIIRAAKQAGASEVVVKIGEQSLIVRLGRSTASEKALEQDEEIVLW
jgi:hypothetical protein